MKLNLTAKTDNEKMVLAHLESVATEILTAKINNGNTKKAYIAEGLKWQELNG